MTEEQKRGHVLSIDAICGAGKSTLCRFIDQHFGSGSKDVDDDERRRRLTSLLEHGHISDRPLSWSASDVSGVDALPEPGTTGHAIARMLIAGRVKVVVETPNEVLLKRFYEDPETYAWFLQNVTQKGCAEIHLNARVEAENHDTLVLIDRSAIGNAAFAHLNRHLDDNRISYDQLCHFDDFTKKYILKQFPCDTFVLLDMPLETCVKRLKQRKEKTNESIPDAAYLEQLRNLHDMLMSYTEPGQLPYAPNLYDRKVLLQGEPHMSVSEVCQLLLKRLFQ